MTHIYVTCLCQCPRVRKLVKKIYVGGSEVVIALMNLYCILISNLNARISRLYLVMLVSTNFTKLVSSSSSLLFLFFNDDRDSCTAFTLLAALSNNSFGDNALSSFV